MIHALHPQIEARITGKNQVGRDDAQAARRRIDVLAGQRRIRAVRSVEAFVIEWSLGECGGRERDYREREGYRFEIAVCGFGPTRRFNPGTSHPIADETHRERPPHIDRGPSFTPLVTKPLRSA